MVEFETLETKEIQFGNNKFLEVARKVAKTPEGNNEFISISKGFIAPTGQKRFKNALGFPADKNIVDGLVEALNSLDMSAAPVEEETTEEPAAEETAEETTEEPAAEETAEEAPAEETTEEPAAEETTEEAPAEEE
ncbi:MAG: hypothetical protein GOV02_01570 [Candidatus Aenigmarchaeota archaeon]|nr:hypothetical protein [Candidatus Aenigmarchaeota archaeon]